VGWSNINSKRMGEFLEKYKIAEITMSLSNKRRLHSEKSLEKILVECQFVQASLTQGKSYSLYLGYFIVPL
jgi:hypothetical protein